MPINENPFVNPHEKPVEGIFEIPSGTYITDGVAYYYFTTVTKEGFVSATTSTDHYCENGSVIQDHVVNHPFVYTLTGLIAEKYHAYQGEPESDTYVKRVETQDTLRKLQTFSQFMPTWSSYVYSAINTGRFVANRVTQITKTVEGILGKNKLTNKIRDSFENMPDGFTGVWGLNKNEYSKVKKESETLSGKKEFLIHKEQQKWAFLFDEARRKHTLFTLHCPYGVVKNMIIENIDCGQDKSWSVSNISITLKQIRFIGVDEGILNIEKSDTDLQKMEEKNLGNLPITESPVDKF